jgi:formamidopyrimidine-DNA glycosylase
LPELPEVETTRRGLSPHLVGRELINFTFRRAQLRWPIPTEQLQALEGETLLDIERRAKYLLFRFQSGTIIGHLGMSGSMRIVSGATPVKKHDHVDFGFSDDKTLRYHDPRRFGAILFTDDAPELHPLIASLGPEPLAESFNQDYLFDISRKRSTNIKTFIMNSAMVVGVGNIYASEALFMAGIRPTTAAGKISRERLGRLVASIKQVLAQSIEQGGTTLRDFVNSDGAPGYFKQQLAVYGKATQKCSHCQAPIKVIKQSGRATYFCPLCQR